MNAIQIIEEIRNTLDVHVLDYLALETLGVVGITVDYIKKCIILVVGGPVSFVTSPELMERICGPVTGDFEVKYMVGSKVYPINFAIEREASFELSFAPF